MGREARQAGTSAGLPVTAGAATYGLQPIVETAEGGLSDSVLDEYRVGGISNGWGQGRVREEYS